MGTTQHECPKCHASVLVIATEGARVSCPKCKVPLLITDNGLEYFRVARKHNVTPATGVRTRRNNAALATDIPSEGMGLVITAFSLAGLLMLAVIVGLVVIVFGDSDTDTAYSSLTLRSKHDQDTVRLGSFPQDNPGASEPVHASSQQQMTSQAEQAREARRAKEIAAEEEKKRQAQEAKIAQQMQQSELANMPSSLAETIAAVRPSVATIEHASGSGSGFILTQSRWLATNLHVVAGAGKARAFRNNDNGTQVEMGIAGFVACDPGKDLVILVLEKDWPAEPLVLSSAPLQLGEDVFAIGSPIGLSDSITRGIVSQIRSASDIQNNNLSPSTKIIQTDAFMTSGSSGGPLCSNAGKVIGINTFGISSDADEHATRIHFAVSAEELGELAYTSLGRKTRPLDELPQMRD